MTYEPRRYFTPSSLLASQTTSLNGRARKKQMKPAPLTYGRLLEQQQQLVESGKLNRQTAANRATALRNFMRCIHVQLDDVVGNELRCDFESNVAAFSVALASSGKGARDISNTRATLRSWHHKVVEHDTLHALESDKETPFQNALAALLANQSAARVAKEAGVPVTMLYGWIHGKLPRASNVRFIARLEAFYGVERGALSGLAGIANASRFRANSEPPSNEYRSSLLEQTRRHYWLKPGEDSPLRRQWMDFVRYKTDELPELERSLRAQWRLSPLPLRPATEANWFMFLDGQEVASAHSQWAKVGSYLGWLSLPESEGGKGIPHRELQTMAWFAVPGFLVGYLDWRKRKSGGHHSNWAPEFLGWLQSILRPEVGYFPQCPWLRETLPERYRSEDWNEMCRQQMRAAKRLTASLRGKIQVRRDPFAPIAHAVGLAEPLEAVVDMVQRMRLDRPVGNEATEAIWARDIALIKLLASNPLRLRQFAHMVWKPDNTGNLYQKPDGSWHIRWRSRFFKNARGAAGEQDYDSPVQPNVWADLERYLFKHRPKLMRQPTDLVFLSHSCGTGPGAPHKPWSDLSRRVQALTKRYLWKCPGVGCHSMRHITGTAIIKAAPGEFNTAAKVLNDRPETVEKHYARFTSGDGALRMWELLDKSFKRM